MRASSVGLEIDVYVSENEIQRLGNGERVETSLNFREVQSDKRRQIPLALEYVGGRSEEIDVKQIPSRCYFGEAKQITIILQDYLYECLKERGMCCDRFFGSGKVIIQREP